MRAKTGTTLILHAPRESDVPGFKTSCKVGGHWDVYTDDAAENGWSLEAVPCPGIPPCEPQPTIVGQILYSGKLEIE